MKKSRKLSSCCLMVAAAVLLLGCSQVSKVERLPPDQVAPLTGMPSPVLVNLPSFYELTDLVEHSVVTVDTESVVNTGYIQSRVQGAGSGWIIDESGIIVTNNHVIEGAHTITVQLRDGSSYTPEFVRGDPTSDIAIIKIKAGKLPVLKVADTSKLKVGDWVVAVGNALGMGISVKNGIVSRLGVSVRISSDEVFSNLIETNAAINPGNSGGPLVNLSAEVVGITSLKLSTAGAEGMGYAINIADAMPIIQRLSRSEGN